MGFYSVILLTPIYMQPTVSCVVSGEECDMDSFQSGHSIDGARRRRLDTHKHINFLRVQPQWAKVGCGRIVISFVTVSISSISNKSSISSRKWGGRLQAIYCKPPCNVSSSDFNCSFSHVESRGGTGTQQVRKSDTTKGSCQHRLKIHHQRPSMKP